MKTFILLLAALSFVPSSFAAEGVHYISVRGEGEIKARPDLVSVSLNVHSRAKDAKAAQARNAKEMERVMEVLKSQFKIEARDIQTSSFRVNPEYDYRANKREFVGYVVDHSLQLTYRKLDKVGDLLDKVVSGQPNEDLSVQIQGISFDSEKRKELEVQALELAMKNAVGRAEALARFAKKSIKSVLRISDSSVSYQPYREAQFLNKSMMAADSIAAPTQISGGEITVNSTVAVEYEID